MPEIITTLGPKTDQELGMILPHELVIVDLRTWDSPGYAQAEVDQVKKLLVPELTRARAAGVTAIVGCSTVGGELPSHISILRIRSFQNCVLQEWIRKPSARKPIPTHFTHSRVDPH